MGLLLGVSSHTTFILQHTTKRQGRTTSFLECERARVKAMVALPAHMGLTGDVSAARCAWLLCHSL